MTSTEMLEQASKLKIRTANKSDIPLLEDVERSAAIAFSVLPGYQPGDRTVPAELLTEMSMAGKLWVAEMPQEKLVGFIGCRDMGNFLYLHEISVRQDFQKQGIGRSLMQTVINNARSNGYLIIGLTTRKDAAWNMPFYNSLGFLEIKDAKEWPELFVQLQKEIADGADPHIRCAMIKLL